MKKKMLGMLLCATMIIGLLAGCGNGGEKEAGADDGKASAGDGGKKVYALVTKSAGNPFMDIIAGGFTEVIEAAGGEVIIRHPEAATADAQVSVIQSLISQGVDSITVSANDPNALQAALEEAMDAGIKVSCMDSATNADSRQVFVNQATDAEIGSTLIEAIYDISGGEGQFAILSATSQATNQNAWIAAMEETMKDDKYSKLELVEIAYGDDELQKSTDQTQALLAKYPDLKVICSPTTVGISAAAKVLQDDKSSVKLTGLGLPSDLAEYIGDGADKSCPYMYLWNPIELGQLGGYTAMALVNGDIAGAEGDGFTAGDLGDYKVVKAKDGGTEVVLGPLFRFDASNIDEWKEVF